MDRRHRRPVIRVLLIGIALLGGLVLTGAASAEQPATGARSHAAADPATRGAEDRPTIRVGTEGTYPPFSYRDSKTNAFTGYDIEVMRAVARKAGWNVRFVQTQWDAIFAALDSDRIDAVANQVTINPERSAKYLFSTPYTYSHGVIVTRAGEKSITSLKDLRGKVAAENATSNWAEVARKAGAKIQTIESFNQAASLLEQGRVDVIVNDNIAVLDYLSTSGSKRIKIAGDAGSDVSRQALAFRQDEPELQQKADAALKELRADGTLKKISEKYFGADVSVQEKSTIKVADRSVSTLDRLKNATPDMIGGLFKGTLLLTVICFSLGLVLALAAALARLSGIRALSLIAGFYISAIRGTPLLVQLFIVFYGLGQIGIDLGPYPSAILALSLNVGAYAAEVIRASILSVPRGQTEAATSIGLGYSQTLRRVVLPQGLRIAVPPLSNTLISLVKDTSLVSIVLVSDLFRAAQNAAALGNDFLVFYTVAAAYYWVVCTILSQFQARLEKRLEANAV